MDSNDLLSSADAARVLELTPGAVRLLRQRGELPIAARTDGGIYLFRRGEVERLAALRAVRRPSVGR
jgi:DNA-binding transcriptional MerR regulator